MVRWPQEEMVTTISTALNEGTMCYVDIPQSRKEALMGIAPVCAHKRESQQTLQYTW